MMSMDRPGRTAPKIMKRASWQERDGPAEWEWPPPPVRIVDRCRSTTISDSVIGSSSSPPSSRGRFNSGNTWMVATYMNVPAENNIRHPMAT